MAAMQGYNPDNGFDPKNFNSTGFHPEPPKQEGFKPNDGFNSSGFSNNIEAPKQEGFKSNNDFNSTGFYPSAPDQVSQSPVSASTRFTDEVLVTNQLPNRVARK